MSTDPGLAPLAVAPSVATAAVLGLVGALRLGSPSAGVVGFLTVLALDAGLRIAVAAFRGEFGDEIRVRWCQLRQCGLLRLRFRDMDEFNALWTRNALGVWTLWVAVVLTPLLLGWL